MTTNIHKNLIPLSSQFDEMTYVMTTGITQVFRELRQRTDNPGLQFFENYLVPLEILLLSVFYPDQISNLGLQVKGDILHSPVLEEINIRLLESGNICIENGIVHIKPASNEEFQQFPRIIHRPHNKFLHLILDSCLLLYNQLELTKKPDEIESGSSLNLESIPQFKIRYVLLHLDIIAIVYYHLLKERGISTDLPVALESNTQNIGAIQTRLSSVLQLFDTVIYNTKISRIFIENYLGILPAIRPYIINSTTQAETNRIRNPIIPALNSLLYELECIFPPNI